MARPAGVEVRLYRETDDEAIKSFLCADPGKKWTREAQEAIRSSVDDIAEPDTDAQIVVASEADRIVGVVVFGVDPQHTKTRTIFSLGVSRDRRRRRIGISLKQAALTEIRDSGYVGKVYSQVHKCNTPMRRLNECLNALAEKDPDDGKLVLTVVNPQVLAEPDS